MALVATAALAATTAAAWPDKQIRLVVPFGAGSPPDTLARILSESWRRSGFADAVVVNQPGAAGSLGVAQVAKAAPDGYTLAIAGDAAIVVNPAIYPDLPLSPLRDLTPVSQLVVTPTVLVVGRDVAARTVADLVAMERAKPGSLTFASAGGGTSSHRNGLLLRQQSGVELLHVPYKTNSLPDIVGGRVTMTFANVASAAPHLAEGRLRALAVASRQRMPALPDVPTMAEAGFPGVDSVAWFGLVGPAGLPPEIAERLRDEAAKALRDPANAARLDALGGQVTATTPADFRALVERELPRGRAFVREHGLKAD